MKKPYLTIPPLSEQEKERFWSNVDRTPGQGVSGHCWIWQRSLTDKGYGRIAFKGQYYAAHRVAYFLTFGDLDTALSVCHTCDTPPCCNPECLWQGTQKENIQDMIKKGRGLSDEMRSILAKSFTPKGEAHGRSKLTEQQVREIRSLYIPHQRGYKILARQFGVSPSCIALIIKRRKWAHVV